MRTGSEGICVAVHATSSVMEDFFWSPLAYRKESLSTVPHYLLTKLLWFSSPESIGIGHDTGRVLVRTFGIPPLA